MSLELFDDTDIFTGWLEKSDDGEWSDNPVVKICASPSNCTIVVANFLVAVILELEDVMPFIDDVSGFVSVGLEPINKGCMIIVV